MSAWVWPGLPPTGDAAGPPRLAASLALAAALHLLLFASLPSPRPWSTASPSLRLELRRPAAPLPAEIADTPATAPPRLAGGAIPPPPHPDLPRNPGAAAERSPPVIPLPAPTPAQAERPSLDQARALARSLGRELEQGEQGRAWNAPRFEPRPGGNPGHAPALADRPSMAAIERIAQRPSERRVSFYADGTMRIDDPSGQSRCLRPLAPTPSVGPLEMIAVPTNCP